VDRGARACFRRPPGYAIPEAHLDNSLITPDSPARAGEIIVVYACGLGRTQSYPEQTAIAQSAAAIQRLSDLRVYLGGTAINPASILYAGVTRARPGHQITWCCRTIRARNPEIRVAIADQSSPAGLKLAVQ